MPTIRLDHLAAHPDNTNRMPADLLEKLTRNIEESGKYPPIIVRPLPASNGQYQILDGHHRARALGELGHESARCEIWEVDDEQATFLLLTLNRLEGSDDPQARGELLSRLAGSSDLAELARRLPEDAARLRKLIKASEPPPPTVSPPDPEAMPQGVTFFLTALQRRNLVRRLRAVATDRSAALVSLLELDELA